MKRKVTLKSTVIMMSLITFLLCFGTLTFAMNSNEENKGQTVECREKKDIEENIKEDLKNIKEDLKTIKAFNAIGKELCCDIGDVNIDCWKRRFKVFLNRMKMDSLVGKYVDFIGNFDEKKMSGILKSKNMKDINFEDVGKKFKGEFEKKFGKDFKLNTLEDDKMTVYVFYLSCLIKKLNIKNGGTVKGKNTRTINMDLLVKCMFSFCDYRFVGFFEDRQKYIKDSKIHNPEEFLIAFRKEFLTETSKNGQCKKSAYAYFLEGEKNYKESRLSSKKEYKEEELENEKRAWVVVFSFFYQYLKKYIELSERGISINSPEQICTSIKEEQPKTEQPKAEQPKAEQPKTEQPKAEQPKAEQPKAEQSKAEQSKAEQSKAGKPKRKTSKKRRKQQTNQKKTEKTQAKNSKAEQPKAEQPEAEQSEAEQPKAEQSKAEQPKKGQPKAEQSEAEQSKAEQPEAEQPKAEQPKAEQSEAEQPKAEQPKAEQSEAEQSKAEQSKAEQSKAEQSKAEQSKRRKQQTNQPEKKNLPASKQNNPKNNGLPNVDVNRFFAEERVKELEKIGNYTKVFTAGKDGAERNVYFPIDVLCCIDGRVNQRERIIKTIKTVVYDVSRLPNAEFSQFDMYTGITLNDFLKDYFTENAKKCFKNSESECVYRYKINNKCNIVFVKKGNEIVVLNSLGHIYNGLQ